MKLLSSAGYRRGLVLRTYSDGHRLTYTIDLLPRIARTLSPVRFEAVLPYLKKEYRNREDAVHACAQIRALAFNA